MAGRMSMGARREIKAAVVERYRVAGRAEKGRILDELCKVTQGNWLAPQKRDASAGRSTGGRT